MSRTNKALIASLSWSVLICFDGYIDKYGGGWVHFASIISILILTILILVYIIKELIALFKSRRNLTLKTFLPLTIYFVTPFIMSIAASAIPESKVVLRGCYEGTQNQAYILFKQDNTFELNWTGVFFHDEWFKGTWERHGDTINLKYHGDMVKPLGKKVVIKDGYFKPIGGFVDTLKYPWPMFYVGYCKHKN